MNTLGLIRTGLGAMAAACLLLSACSEDESKPTEPASGGSPATVVMNQCVSYEDFAGPFLLNWCVGCHSSSLAVGERQLAPPEVNFDTLEGVRAHAAQARKRVFEDRNMPPVGGPSDQERQLFADWIDCDLPSSGAGFVPPAPTGLPPELTPPMGACADSRMYVPPSILPRCTASTLDCVVQCGVDNPEYDQEACRNACLAADTTPADSSLGLPINCANCTLAQVLACSDNEGCHDETAAFICCLEACGGGDACNAECNGELQAFGLCVYYTAPQCVDYVDGPVGECFAQPPAMMADAGVAGSGGASSDAGLP